MAPKSVGHDHLVSVLFGDLLSHSYNITFSMFLYLVCVLISLAIPTNITFWKCFLYLVQLLLWSLHYLQLCLL